MIKIFGGEGVGGRGGDTFKPPPPTNNFCLYPPPVLRCFWKDPLMTPTTPLQASFPATPLNYFKIGQGNQWFRSVSTTCDFSHFTWYGKPRSLHFPHCASLVSTKTHSVLQLQKKMLITLLFETAPSLKSITETYESDGKLTGKFEGFFYLTKQKSFYLNKQKARIPKIN